jgi:hypothetical protein
MYLLIHIKLKPTWIIPVSLNYQFIVWIHPRMQQPVHLWHP